MKKGYRSPLTGQKRISRSGTVYEVQADGSWRKVGFLSEEQVDAFMKQQEEKKKDGVEEDEDKEGS